MEIVAWILIAIFASVLVCGPFLCILYNRRDRATIFDPKPKHIREAHRKLSTFTARSSVRHEEDLCRDLESTICRAELGECPICIGPLVPELARIAGADPQPALEQIASVTTRGPAPTTSEKPEEILTLNTCGHSFHSKCLATWFLASKYDCPLCRQTYYTAPPEKPRLLSVHTIHRVQERLSELEEQAQTTQQ